jgi:hypothetical protein
MEQVTVGIDGDCIATGLGYLDAVYQIGVHRGLTAEKDDVGLFFRSAEQAYPRFHLLPAQHRRAMLPGIDIAVGAGQVAGGEKMEKYISLSGLETYRMGSTHGM